MSPQEFNFRSLNGSHSDVLFFNVWKDKTYEENICILTETLVELDMSGHIGERSNGCCLFLLAATPAWVSASVRPLQLK